MVDYFLLLSMAFQAVFVFALGPLAVGLIRSVKARFQGRRGPPLFQPYFDLLKLFRKNPVKSEASSWVFDVGPYVSFAAVAALAALVPLLHVGTLSAVDWVVVAYVFAIPRFMTALSGLDVASAFGGLGASRELLFSAFLEPAFFAFALFLATFDPSLHLGTLFYSVPAGSLLASPAHWLAAAAFFILLLAETGRLPFDNPATHLELTMVHEAMILDHSGPALALIEWAQSAKMVLLFGIFAGFFFPLSAFTVSSLLFAALAFGTAVLVVSAFTAVLESVTPKLRLFKAPELIVFSLVLGILAFLVRASGLEHAGDWTVWLALVMLVCNLYFLFSATFKRRLQIYFVQSLALASILVFVTLEHQNPDAYIRLASTVILKVILVPILLLKAFRALAGSSKTLINADPLYLDAPVGTSGALVASGLLILLSFLMAPYLGAQSVLLPAALAILLTGGLIISIKPHVLLQLMGFLLLENGLVLLPVALGVEIPLVAEATTLFDTLTLIVVALVLVFKINNVVESLDSEKLNRLTEGS